RRAVVRQIGAQLEAAGAAPLGGNCRVDRLDTSFEDHAAAATGVYGPTIDPAQLSIQTSKSIRNLVVLSLLVHPCTNMRYVPCSSVWRVVAEPGAIGPMKILQSGDAADPAYAPSNSLPQSLVVRKASTRPV